MENKLFIFDEAKGILNINPEANFKFEQTQECVETIINDFIDASFFFQAEDGMEDAAEHQEAFDAQIEHVKAALANISGLLLYSSVEFEELLNSGETPHEMAQSYIALNARLMEEFGTNVNQAAVQHAAVTLVPLLGDPSLVQMFVSNIEAVVRDVMIAELGFTDVANALQEAIADLSTNAVN